MLQFYMYVRTQPRLQLDRSWRCRRRRRRRRQRQQQTDEMDWSSLPLEIIELTSSKVCLSDYITFSSICTSWKAAAKSTWVKKKPNCFRLPWIMLPKDETGRSGSRSFYCLDHRKHCQLPLTSMARNSWCAGSCHGWLINSHPTTKKNFLFNPFTGARLPLPAHSYMGEGEERRGTHPYYLSKVILTSDPVSTDDCLVVAIFDDSVSWFSCLGVCRAGDKNWLKWTGNLFDDDIVAFMDAIDNDDIIFDADDEGHDHHNELGDHHVEEELSIFSIGKRTIFGPVDEEDSSSPSFLFNIGDRFIFREVGDETDKEKYQILIQKQGDDQGERVLELTVELEDDPPTTDEEYYDEDEEEDQLFRLSPAYRLTDIIHYKEKIYAARSNGKVYVFKILTNRDDNGSISVSWKLVRTTWRLRLKRKFDSAVYLVESIHGELLMVVRVLRYSRHNKDRMTSKFMVFKLNDDPEEEELANWVTVESLGDEQAIFVGQSCSQAVRITPQVNGLRRGNCIYYTDDKPANNCMITGKHYGDSGVFYLDPPSEEPNLQSLPENYKSLLGSYAHSFKYPPLWITPNITF